MKIINRKGRTLRLIEGEVIYHSVSDDFLGNYIYLVVKKDGDVLEFDCTEGEEAPYQLGTFVDSYRRVYENGCLYLVPLFEGDRCLFLELEEK